MKDFYFSQKLSILIRRIKISGVAYTIRPSFAMPHMTGIVGEVEKALFLRKFGVPFWALSHVFGRDHMYWYRMEQALGRNSIVGTTIRNPNDIPLHLSADEKHTWILGEKAYIATTVGGQCILGASIAKNAREDGLQDAYQVFKDETRCIKPDYTPDTVNIDGWKPTHNVWNFLFSSAVIIFCFLHVFIKVRDRGKKKYKDIFEKIADKLWKCYQAETKGSFSQRIRRLIEWCKNNDAPETLSKPIKKLKENIYGMLTNENRSNSRVQSLHQTLLARCKSSPGMSEDPEKQGIESRQLQRMPEIDGDDSATLIGTHRLYKLNHLYLP
jgi:hypothetical protein